VTWEKAWEMVRTGQYWLVVWNKNIYGKSPFSMDKSTINGHGFNSYISYVKLAEGNIWLVGKILHFSIQLGI